MYEIDNKLEQLEERGTPISVGLIGAGQMGTEIVCQIQQMKGMSIDVIVDIKQENCINALKDAEYKGGFTCTDSLEQAEKALAEGKKVISSDYEMPILLKKTQVIIDATGIPEMGARISLLCFNNNKHIVMMNVECDITVGPILRQMAENASVVYSLTAGDEPGSIVEVCRFARALGFRIVAAGKGKNNPLDIYATPKEWEQKASERDMNARMLVEFVDGSKTMIEMAAVSNATGLTPDKRGMHGPRCNIKDLAKVFALKEQGGLLNHEGVVDYGIGDINPGVFVIVTTDNMRLREGLRQRDMGPGPNYLLLRPYHLCSVETPITAAQAVLYGESTAHPMKKLVSECITIAKRDLKAGEVLDRIGEYCYRGSIDHAEVARTGKMLPLGLAYGARLKCDVAKDTVITYDMVELDEKSVLLQLRRIQDTLM